MAGHGGADRTDAAAAVDRPLIELLVEELEAFVKDGMKLLTVAKGPTDRVIEGRGADHDGSLPDRVVPSNA